MSSNEHSVRGWFKKDIALGIGRISEEYTRLGVWLQFMSVIRSEQSKTCATKSPKMGYIWFGLVWDFPR